jgi:hypothetical protein
MTKDIQVTLRWLTVMACVFAPFLLVLYALLQIPGGVQVFSRTEPMDWIWLMLLGGMMLGVYYFLAVYLEDEEEICAEFRKLDRDEDGYLCREDVSAWPELRLQFDRFDQDHDGRLSRADFENFEHAFAHT